jgi:hypothetical protein
MTRESPPAWAVHALIICGVIVAIGGAGETDENESLAMSPAIACKSIEGYEDFEPLPDAALTSDEKLLVYYRPTGFRTEPVGDKFRAHFVQDARIRRRGQKAVLKSRMKLLEYEVKSDIPPDLIYLRNTISLKGLKPGHYELDIILHDKIGGGSPATQVLAFQVVAAPQAPPSPSPDETEAR